MMCQWCCCLARPLQSTSLLLVRLLGSFPIQMPTYLACIKPSPLPGLGLSGRGAAAVCRHRPHGARQPEARAAGDAAAAHRAAPLCGQHGCVGGRARAGGWGQVCGNVAGVWQARWGRPMWKGLHGPAQQHPSPRQLAPQNNFLVCYRGCRAQARRPGPSGKQPLERPFALQNVCLATQPPVCVVAAGYGHGDLGREALDAVVAEVMGAEAAAVRIQFVSGTHAISSALFGCLR